MLEKVQLRLQVMATESIDLSIYMHMFMMLASYSGLCMWFHHMCTVQSVLERKGSILDWVEHPELTCIVLMYEMTEYGAGRIRALYNFMYTFCVCPFSLRALTSSRATCCRRALALPALE